MASQRDLQMSEDKARYYRYISLLNDGGKLVLLAKYEALVPNNDILLNLQQQKHIIRTLPLRKRISDTQYDLLYPASGQADPSTFDLTLLTFLLRSTCCLRANSAVWDPQTPPCDSDISVEADVARLRNLRNKLIGHPEKTAMSAVEFEHHWQSLKKILLRLVSSIPDLEDRIDDLKVAAMEPDRQRELQAVKASWDAAENLLHGAVAVLREDVDELQTSHTGIKRELEDVKTSQGKRKPTAAAALADEPKVVYFRTMATGSDKDLPPPTASMEKATSTEESSPSGQLEPIQDGDLT